MNPWTYDNGVRLAAAAGVAMAIHGKHYAESGPLTHPPGESGPLTHPPAMIADDRETSAGWVPQLCTMGRMHGGTDTSDTGRLAEQTAVRRRTLGATAPRRARGTRARVVDDSPLPRLLQRRVDALYIGYNGSLRPELGAHLAQRTDEAKLQGLAVAIDLDMWGAVLSLSPRSHCARGHGGMRGWWRLSCDEISAVIDTEGTAGWRLEVRPTALLLGRIGHEAACGASRELAAAILADVLDERVRRLDLCCDWTGYGLEAIQAEEWIAPRRTSPRDLALTDRYWKAAVVTGWGIGKSDISHRTYDKSRELRNPGQELKRQEEHARWRAAGWNGQDEPTIRVGKKVLPNPEYQPVTRTEFQVRGDALKQFPGLGDLRRADTLFPRLDDLWSYLTDARPNGPRGAPKTSGEAGWCRLIVAGTASRRKRCRTQRRWRAVQQVSFLGVGMPVPERSRVHAPAPERRMVGQALDLVASEGLHEIPAGPLGKMNLVDIGVAREMMAQARESYAGWSEEEAEGWVRRLLEDHRLVSRFKHATRSWAEDEAQRRGSWKGAAAYFIERMRSSVARRAALHEVLLERAALAKCGSDGQERAASG